jgi:uncharacterized delta-60 repeat protein
MLVKKEFCDNPSNLSYLLDYLINDNNTIVTPYTPTHDTAIVMIHGWQRLDDIFKGDEPSKNAAHCKAWFNVMKAFQHKSGDWATLRASTDLFTFRYDSDDRISNNGIKLSLAIEKLRDTYWYQNVILLGHSMGGIVSVDARTKIAGTNPIRGIVTLATPFMGGPIECTLQSSGFCIAITSINLSDLGNPRMLALKTLAHIIDLNSPDEGTKDLTSYYGNTPNPYLTNLWSNPNNFNNVYALYGLNLENTFTPTFAIGEAALVLGWGRSDGVVPYSSAVGSATLQLSGTPTPAPNLNAQPSVSRDHNQFTGGCTPCTSNGYDPYYDKVAMGLKSFLPLPGSLDTTFGNGGKVITPIGSYSGANSVAIDSSGKIIVAGESNSNGTWDFALVRYNVNGNLDTSFGTNGKVITPVGSSSDSGGAVVIDGSGKIVVAGYSFNSNVYADFALVRYNVNGSLDTSFGTGGKVTTDLNSNDGAGSVAINNSGKIVVAGYSGGGFAVVRYNVNGNLDTSFGTNGKIVTPLGVYAEVGNAVIDSGGRIVVAGHSRNSNGNADFAVVRYNSNGSLDTNFGASGKVITPVGSRDDYGRSVTIDSNGKIVVVGGATYDRHGSSNFAMVRYNP